jgi:hypothetical protein
MKIYGRIAEFCAVRNVGSAFENDGVATPRLMWLARLCAELGLPARVDRFQSGGIHFYNLIIEPEGGGRRWVSAHHDIVNPNSDNANDNSASCINAIALRLERPDIGVIICDGEEVGGIGAIRFCELIESGEIERPDWILNLELTGLGGESFFYGGEGSNGPLGELIRRVHPTAPRYSTPFNDSVRFRGAGLDSLVINPLPRLENDALDWSPLSRCHSTADSLDGISVEDMQSFVERVLLPIFDAQ